MPTSFRCFAERIAARIQLGVADDLAAERERLRAPRLSRKRHRDTGAVAVERRAGECSWRPHRTFRRLPASPSERCSGRRRCRRNRRRRAAAADSAATVRCAKPPGRAASARRACRRPVALHSAPSALPPPRVRDCRSARAHPRRQCPVPASAGFPAVARVHAAVVIARARTRHHRQGTPRRRREFSWRTGDQTSKGWAKKSARRWGEALLGDEERGVVVERLLVAMHGLTALELLAVGELGGLAIHNPAWCGCSRSAGTLRAVVAAGPLLQPRWRSWCPSGLPWARCHRRDSPAARVDRSRGGQR